MRKVATSLIFFWFPLLDFDKREIGGIAGAVDISAKMEKYVDRDGKEFAGWISAREIDGVGENSALSGETLKTMIDFVPNLVRVLTAAAPGAFVKH